MAHAGLITGCLGLASFSLAGLYCNHADLSPRHAPLLLGVCTCLTSQALLVHLQAMPCLGSGSRTRVITNTGLQAQECPKNLKLPPSGLQA